MKKIERVAVIGAGIAGLACAAVLKQANFHVSVFDKSKGPAGRMSTRRGDSWECDHGAQYFTARDTDFRAEVARWEQAGVAGPWRPRIKVFDGAALLDRDSSLERFVGIPRMTSPARLIAEDLDLTSPTTIQELRRNSEGWALRSAEHGWLSDSFAAVVLALPAPQSTPLLESSSPEFAAIAQSAKMRGAWAMMLRYPKPVDLPFDGVFVNDGPLRWVARNSSKPGRGGDETWLLHASPEWSEANIEASSESVAPTLLAAFAEFGGPEPQAWTAHRWRYADTGPALELGCLWNPAAGIGLCGDWLNGGKVQGAWLSGKALAQRVVESLRGPPSADSN
jgi:renalase